MAASNSTMKMWLPRLGGSRQRFELNNGDVGRLENTGKYIRIRIVSGSAWVTVNGQDIVLKRAGELQLPPGHDTVVISSLKGTPLVYEVL